MKILQRIIFWLKFIYITYSEKATIFFAKSPTYYLTDPYIVFTLKMESQPKSIIFSLKMTMKSEWSRKNYFEIPSYEKLFSLISGNSQNHKVIKITIFTHGGNSK